MYTAQADKVLLGRGKVFFDRLTPDGASTGLRFLGTASKFEITTNDERAKIYDYSRADAPLLEEALTRREVNFAMTLHEFTRENVALALMGTETQFTQTAGSVTDEVIAFSVVKGRTYQTLGRRITGITVEKGPAPGTLMVLGLDYDIVDAELGLIHIREDGSTVADGNSVLCTYTRTAITTPGLNRVSAARSASILGKLVYVGDPAAGIAYDMEVWRLRISSEGALGLITESEFGGFELKGTVLSDEANTPSDPYFRLTQRNSYPL